MTSIVIELQRDSLDDSIETPTLLRKALLVAKKLKIELSIGWIMSELEGYSGDNEIPDYRQVIGRTVGRTATQELPFICNDPDIAKLTSSFALPISISEIESLLRGQSPGMQLGIPLPPKLQTAFNSLTQYNATFMFQMDYSQIEHIQQSVRTKILNWGMKLEEDGVLGEGYTFTREEREKGNHISINISGDASNFQIQQAGANANQNQSISSSLREELTQYMERVIEQLENIDFHGEDKKEVTAELETISAQLELPSPKKSIIVHALSGLLKILSTVAAHELVQEGISLVSSLV